MSTRGEDRVSSVSHDESSPRSKSLIDLFADDIVWRFPGSRKRSVTTSAVTPRWQVWVSTDKPPAARSAPTSSTSWPATTTSPDGPATARVARQSLAFRAVVIFKMKDGTATEGWHHFDDLTALDNFLHRGCASDGVVV
jgi:ketosteroid isomerase-like protein